MAIRARNKWPNEACKGLDETKGNVSFSNGNMPILNLVEKGVKFCHGVIFVRVFGFLMMKFWIKEIEEKLVQLIILILI